MRAGLLLLLLAACTSTSGKAPPVAAVAVQEADGLRVHFRRAPVGAGGQLARLEASGGALEQVVHSPDRGSVSALWRGAGGVLRCSFPDGGVGTLRADEAAPSRDVEYVFLNVNGAEISARLPAASPMRPVLTLHVRVDAELLPAVLELPDHSEIAVDTPEATVLFPLPSDGGALREGDSLLRLRIREGKAFPFLIGVDRDGVPTATSGFLRNW